MASSIGRIKEIIRRPRGSGVDYADDSQRREYSRTHTQTLGPNRDDDPPLSNDVTMGNTALATPDDTRGLAYASQVNGQRLQDYANTHISEGEAPGRIPWFWNDRRYGKVGRGITGNEAGDNSLTLDVTGIGHGGLGDAKFIPHQVVPRGMATVRAHTRTIDDSATVPAVYVSDPTRR